MTSDPWKRDGANGAVLSDCRTYRYALWRQLSGVTETYYGGYCMFIGLNPSTADEKADDPTIRRCKAFALAWGYQALVMANLFAFRATDPRVMKAAPDPVGPANNEWLLGMGEGAGMVVAAWGAHGSHQGRAAAVRNLVPKLHYLRLTKDGSPGHPLYLPSDLRPQPWH